MADRRELLEQAWSAAEAEDNEELNKDTPEPETGVASEPDKGEDTEPVKEEGESEYKGDDTLEVEKKAAAAREKPPVKETSTEPTDKAPASWRPTQREQWSKLPADVRLEISRREREIQEGMKQTEGIRRFANEFAQVVQPYSHLIAQSGSTPLRAVESLMRTAAGLTTGSQEQKAQILANIIGQYGVDLKTLDRVLSSVVQDGRVQTRNPQPEQPPQWARPMFDFMQTIEQRRQQAEQQAAQQAHAAVEAMQEKPFFDDLRDEMADIMEVAARRGVKMTLEQAYERAVQNNDEIRTIIQQRKNAASARSPVSEAAATLARARRAASTVSGGPSGEATPSKSSPKSRREAIENAWAAASGE